jgi:signal peptidase I
MENIPGSEAPVPALPELPAEEKKSPIPGFLWEVVQTLAIALILYFLVDTFIARARVENISMQPTLKAGEFLLVNKYAYKWGQLQRGDVIVFHHTVEPGVDYIKRLIAIPGDRVRMQNGTLYINGQAIQENYIMEPASYSGEWKVPPDMIFALGDNRNMSSDSHAWGFVSQSDLVGKAFVVYFPFDQIRLLNDVILPTP